MISVRSWHDKDPVSKASSHNFWTEMKIVEIKFWTGLPQPIYNFAL